VPRIPVTSDVFRAIAEPRRRRIIELLASSSGGAGGGGERAVGELVRTLGIRQPDVSKHLSVLRRARLVSVTRRGRLRLYRLNARQLRPVHEWVRHYERFWSHQLDRIKRRAEQKARQKL
jgi:DNA-binding transcriptional ArsR family regulator